MKLNGKKIDHAKLKQELQAAGINLPGFFEANDELLTYTASGGLTDLPPAAGPVIAAHTLGTAAPRPIETLVTELQAAGSLAEAKSALLKYFQARRSAGAG